ncbi:MAG TPA: hypothetical protein VN667_12270 [Burkholderiales bacterium]|nr:hypothetical protein [Burkholderiales bacterium]
MTISRRDFFVFSGFFLAGYSQTSDSASNMKPSNSASKFKEFVKLRGFDASKLSIPQMVELVLDFYRDVRASGLSKSDTADMLLYQWGVFDWGQGENFEFDITRQFISVGGIGDDAISQLRCTAYFRPTANLRAITAKNRWCDSVADLNFFQSFIRSSDAFAAVKEEEPSHVKIEWNKV